MKVGSVERRLCRTNLAQVGKVVVDKMRERLRWGTCVLIAALCCSTR